MTREAKIGMLTGLGVIVVIGVLLSQVPRAIKMARQPESMDQPAGWRPCRSGRHTVMK